MPPDLLKSFGPLAVALLTAIFGIAALLLGSELTLPSGAKYRLNGLLPFLLRNRTGHQGVRSNMVRTAILPRPTHNQAFFLASLDRREGPSSGPDLEGDILNGLGSKISRAALHTAMQRMRGEGWVDESKVIKIINGKRFHVNRYQITHAGRGALHEAITFYTNLHAFARV
jgi:hypothetical protein